MASNASVYTLAKFHNGSHSHSSMIAQIDINEEFLKLLLQYADSRRGFVSEKVDYNKEFRDERGKKWRQPLYKHLMNL